MRGQRKKALLVVNYFGMVGFGGVEFNPQVNGRLGPDLAEEPDDQETGNRNEQERRASGGEAVVEKNVSFYEF